MVQLKFGSFGALCLFPEYMFPEYTNPNHDIVPNNNIPNGLYQIPSVRALGYTLCVWNPSLGQSGE